MPDMDRISVRFPYDQILALTASAVKLGLVDRNGKPKISTFIRGAMMSNKIFKTKLISIRKLLKEKDE